MLLEKNKTLVDLGQMPKKERKLLKRQQREKERFKYQRQKKLKKFLWIISITLVIGGVVLGLIWFISTRPPLPESEIVSRIGIHRHADLSIKILGKYQDIPANIGISAVGGHRPVHTHELDGVVHMEFSGLVREKDIMLGIFFQNWGKEFSQNCIFDKCNGPDGKVKMFVNGEQNFEVENYIMKDKDKIEIVYE